MKNKVWSMIPESKRSGVDEVRKDEFGYWIYLKEGWNAYGMEPYDHHTIHETTLAELKKQITRIGRENDERMLRKYWPHMFLA